MTERAEYQPTPEDLEAIRVRGCDYHDREASVFADCCPACASLLYRAIRNRVAAAVEEETIERCSEVARNRLAFVLSGELRALPRLYAAPSHTPEDPTP